MKRIVLAGVICLALSTALLLPACNSDDNDSGAPQAEQAASWGPMSNGLQCRLSPASQTVHVAKGAKPEEIKVYLTYELRNMGKESLVFFTWYSPLVDGFVFDVLSPEGRRVSYLGPIPARGMHLSSFITIRPGQSVARPFRLLYNFSKPGTYKVSTRKFDDKKVPEGYYRLKGIQREDTENSERKPDNIWMGLIKSNTVTIEVVPSSSRTDLESPQGQGL